MAVQLGFMRPSRLLQNQNLILQVALLLIVTFTILADLMPGFYLAEMLGHFRLHYILALVILGFLYLRQGRYLFFVCASICLLLNVSRLSDYFPIGAKQSIAMSENKAQEITLLYANIYRDNGSKDDVVEFFRKSGADVIAVVEATENWTAALDGLGERYPYRHFYAREDNFGLAVMSRIQILSSEQIRPGNIGKPTMRFRLDVDSGSFEILLTHAFPPMSLGGFRERNQQLIELASLAASEPDIHILLGDMNVTPWSSVFREVLRVSKFRDAREGLGYRATWPSVLGPLGLPIDQLLLGKDVSLVNMHPVHIPGSDHRGLFARIAVEGDPES